MDTSAQWAASGLTGLLPAPLELVFAETLAERANWEHRVDSDATHLKITLADGRVICSSRIRGVVNRLVTPAMVRAQWPSETEQEYVQSEIHAFYLSWLHGLPGMMINRPSPTCLGGRFLRASEWLYKAAGAGLKTAPYVQTDAAPDNGSYSLLVPEGAVRLSAIVAGECVFPAWLPKSAKAGCVELAKRLEMELMGAEFYLDESGEWSFAGGSATPDLAVGGPPLLECMAAMLQKGGGR